MSVRPTSSVTDPFPLRSKIFGPDLKIFDTRALPVRQRFDAMAAFGAAMYALERREGECAARSQTRSVGGLGLMRIEHKTLRYQLQPTAARDVDPEILLIKRVIAGRQSGMVGEAPMDARPGDICLVDMTRPQLLESDFAVTESVFIPFSRIGYNPSRHAGFAAFRATTGMGRLLGATIGNLLAAAAHNSDADDICAALIAMLGGAVLGRIEDPHAVRAIAATRRAQFRAFIEANLTTPDVSVDDVCRVFGASRATVYRDFADVGGIRTYIQARRLQAARIALEQAQPERGTIVHIAERYGFSSPSQFHRAFRAAFGETPGDVLGRGAPSS